MKIAAVLGWIVLGGVVDGSWKGSAAWAIVIVFLWLVWELMHYDPSNSSREMTQFQATKDFTEEVVTPAIRGKRNPDPTRPTGDDFLGMSTENFNRKRG